MFETKTQENIKAKILQELAKDGLLSIMAGSFADASAGAVARCVSEVYQSLPGVVSMIFVDESSGPYLDEAGRTFWNLVRRPGTKARGQITLTGDPGAMLPADTMFISATGLEFRLREAVTLGEQGAGVGELEAVEAGSRYNLEAGALVRMYVNPVGLSSFASEATSGGTDPESDRSFLARIDERRKRPITSGNGYHYRVWATEVAGVGNAKVVQLANGPGTVGMTVIDANYLPAAGDIVERVTSNVASQRPIGAEPIIGTATGVALTVQAQVTLAGGTSADQVREAFLLALEAYRRSVIQAKYDKVYPGPQEDLPYTILYNRILALLLTIEGVINFSALTVNGGETDVTLQSNEVPTIGEVVIRL